VGQQELRRALTLVLIGRKLEARTLGTRGGVVLFIGVGVTAVGALMLLLVFLVLMLILVVSGSQCLLINAVIQILLEIKKMGL
jgi:hypothetical protein